MSNQNIYAIPAFNDNYIWAIKSPCGKKAALVDPGDANVCIAFLQQHQLQLTAILITHHHRDHTGGITELLNWCNKTQQTCLVYGPAKENIPLITHPLTEQDSLCLFEQQTFTVLDVPGHTSGHIAYVHENLLFCGDTLFSGGCGRLFEGTAEQMLASLNKFKQLPDNTLVYCAHEYTLANLKFALTIEPNNENLQQYFDQVSQQRAQNIATIPCSLANEKNTNPFLRCDQLPIMQSLINKNEINSVNCLATFTKLRALKDTF
jgi:hydroxyacylglutathione hydrolase